MPNGEPGDSSDPAARYEQAVAMLWRQVLGETVWAAILGLLGASALESFGNARAVMTWLSAQGASQRGLRVSSLHFVRIDPLFTLTTTTSLLLLIGAINIAFVLNAPSDAETRMSPAFMAWSAVMADIARVASILAFGLALTGYGASWAEALVSTIVALLAVVMAGTIKEAGRELNEIREREWLKMSIASTASVRRKLQERIPTKSRLYEHAEPGPHFSAVGHFIAPSARLVAPAAAADAVIIIVAEIVRRAPGRHLVGMGVELAWSIATAVLTHLIIGCWYYWEAFIPSRLRRAIGICWLALILLVYLWGVILVVSVLSARAAADTAQMITAVLLPMTVIMGPLVVAWAGLQRHVGPGELILPLVVLRLQRREDRMKARCRATEL